MKALCLTLKKKWFIQIESFEKNKEYRIFKPYWCCRLLRYDGKKKSQKWWKGAIATCSVDPCLVSVIQYGELIMKNGYGRGVPTLLVECLGVSYGFRLLFRGATPSNERVFCFELGSRERIV